MATAVPYPFNMTPQYPGPAMSPAGFGQSQLLHGVSAPQMQGPAPSSVSYGSRFAPDWRTGLPSQGPGPLPGTAGPAPTASAAPRVMPGTSPLPGVAPVAAAANPGIMSRMLGIGGRALGAMASLPATVYSMAAPAVLDAAEQSLPGQMMGAMHPDGFAQSLADIANAPSADAPQPSRSAPAAPYQPAWAPTPRVVQMGNTRVPPAQMPQRRAMAAAPAAEPVSTFREGSNANIGDDVRQRAMAWLALNQGSM